MESEGSDGEVRHIQIGPEKRPGEPNGLPPAQTVDRGEGCRGQGRGQTGITLRLRWLRAFLFLSFFFFVFLERTSAPGAARRRRMEAFSSHHKDSKGRIGGGK